MLRLLAGWPHKFQSKDDAAKNEEAFAKVRADKEREARDGHDGTWVAHPGMVVLRKKYLTYLLQKPNQIHRKREDVQVDS